MGTKQRTGNEVTDRAKVQSRFCSHLSFSHSPCSSSAPRFPLPACRRLLFPLFACATKEIGDVCTLATFPVLITSF